MLATRCYERREAYVCGCNPENSLTNPIHTIWPVRLALYTTSVPLTSRHFFHITIFYIGRLLFFMFRQLYNFGRSTYPGTRHIYMLLYKSSPPFDKKMTHELYFYCFEISRYILRLWPFIFDSTFVKTVEKSVVFIFIELHCFSF